MNEALIESIKQQALSDKVPIMEDEGLAFICQFLKEHNVKSLLEIGTAVGYSAICFASSKSDLTITTLEIDEQRYNQAVRNIAMANLTDRIKAFNNDARDFETAEMFDMILIDGPKTQNEKLLNKFEKNLKPEGYFIIDDVYLHGFVDHPEVIRTRRFRTLVRKLTQFRDNILNNDKYDARYYETGDGIITATRRK